MGEGGVKYEKVGKRSRDLGPRILGYLPRVRETFSSRSIRGEMEGWTERRRGEVLGDGKRKGGARVEIGSARWWGTSSERELRKVRAKL